MNLGLQVHSSRLPDKQYERKTSHGWSFINKHEETELVLCSPRKESCFNHHVGSIIFVRHSPSPANMELSAEQPSEEETSANVSETDDAGSVSVPVDDEGFETLAAEIREVLAELAQVRHDNLSMMMVLIFINFTG